MPSVGDTCLKLSDAKASWPDAKKICQSLEGDLVTLETKSKEVFFEGWLVSQSEYVCYTNFPPPSHQPGVAS